MDAALDAQGNVIGTSPHGEARLRELNPGLDSVVLGAPDVLQVKLGEPFPSPQWHRRTRGDGTSMGDYALIRDREAQKAKRLADLDREDRDLANRDLLAARRAESAATRAAIQAARTLEEMDAIPPATRA